MRETLLHPGVYARAALNGVLDNGEREGWHRGAAGFGLPKKGRFANREGACTLLLRGFHAVLAMRCFSVSTGKGSDQ